MKTPDKRDIRPAAHHYCRKGLMPIPVQRDSKQTVLQGWPKLRIKESDIDQYFDPGHNIGILLGEPSGGLLDVDVDSKEAVSLAKVFLPPTDAVFGRPSKPASHWLYMSNPCPSSSKFKDPNGGMIVEIRSTGQQTVFPPSSHSGEEITWVSNGKPAKVSGAYLYSKAAELAAAALIAKHWPVEGSRQEAALALAGGLLHDNRSEDEVRVFIAAVARAAGDGETEKRATAAEFTQRRLNSGQKCTRWTRLQVLLGDRVVRLAREYLSDSSDTSRKERVDQSATSSEALLQLAEEAELFHTSEGIPYATFTVGDHLETWRAGSQAVKYWLVRKYREQFQKLPPRDALKDVIETLEHRALYDGPERPVFTRIAEEGEYIYLDLCTSDWKIVEIRPDGWDVISRPPVRFRRTAGMAALPVPISGGNIDDLRGLLNVSDDKIWVLLVGWLVGCFRPTGPYLILALQGEAGTAKSTTAVLVRSLIDPSTAPLRSMPSSEDDLIIAAKNSWVPCFDNLSSLSPYLSDALCRLATGGGLSKRKLFTDDEEVIVQATRPIILTGIEDLAAREDLAERCVTLVLSPIPASNRRSQRRLWSEFGALQPQILGGLLDVISSALKNRGEINLENPPRMADVVEWVTAAEKKLGWVSGAFQRAFEENQKDAVAVTIETDPVASGIISLLNDYSSWNGTASTLLSVLNVRVNQETLRSKAWPSSPRALGGRIRRLAPVLRKGGIDLEFDKEPGTRNRLIYLRLSESATVPTVPTVPTHDQECADRDDWDDWDASQPTEENSAPQFEKEQRGE